MGQTAMEEVGVGQTALEEVEAGQTAMEEVGVEQTAGWEEVELIVTKEGVEQTVEVGIAAFDGAVAFSSFLVSPCSS